MGLTSKTTLLSLDKVGPWGPAIRVKHTGNTEEVLGAWGPRYFVGGTGNLVYVKTAADTWSEVNKVYLRTAADTWSAVSQFCVKEDASTWDGTSDEMPGNDLVFDIVAPVFQSAATTTDGTKIILTYNEALASTTAAASAFAVTDGGSAVTVSSVAVSGSTVELTMQSTLTVGAAITVAYTDPSGSDDANAIQDAAGNDSVSLSATSVTNNTAAPVFQSAATSSNGTKVILTYNQTLSSTTAATSAFAVVVNSSAATINAAARGSDTSTIELTLSTAITEGQTVTVAYTDPSGADDANAVQGASGIDCASFTATSVTNTVSSFVTSNLVFHLDAADTSCYSGSGTTVNSLVNNHTNDNWGGMQWSSDSGGNTGGYFYVDGTQTTSLQFPYSTDFEMMNDGTNAITDYSWEWWWYGDSLPVDGSVAMYFAFMHNTDEGEVASSELSTDNKGNYMFYRQSELRERFYVTQASSSNTIVKNNYTWTGSKWQHYVLTRSGNDLKFYVDGGTPTTATQTHPTENNYSNTKKLDILTIYGGSHEFDGRLGIMRFYQGKALTATEVGNNYDAEKSRYT